MHQPLAPPPSPAFPLRVVAGWPGERRLRVLDLADAVRGCVDVPVRSSVQTLAFDPMGRFVAAGGYDGSVTLLEAAALPALTLVKRLDGVRLAEGQATTLNHVMTMALAWHPTGAVLAIASDTGVTVVRRDEWDTVYSLRAPTCGRAVDNVYATTCGVTWSPNGKYLAAVDGRRVVTVWNMTARAIDPATRKPVTVPAITPGAPSTSEPAVELQGYLPVLTPFGTDADMTQLSQTAGSGRGGSGGDDGPVLDPTVLTVKVVAFAWLASGVGIAFADNSGYVNVARIADALSPRHGASAATDAVDALAWPLLAPGKPGPAGVAPDTVLDDDEAALAALLDDDEAAGGGGIGSDAAAQPAAAAAAVGVPPHAVKKAPAPKKGRLTQRYVTDAASVDDEAESAARAGGNARRITDEEVEALLADEALAQAQEEASKSDGGGARGEGGGAVNVSISAIKRKHGYLDDEQDGEGGAGDEGLGTLRRAQAGRGDGDDDLDDTERAAEAAVAHLMADGKVVTTDVLERHVVTTGRYVKEVYGLVAPQAPFQPAATRNKAAKKRYLCWNGFGCIVSRREVTGASISIEFADSMRRAMNVSDVHGFTTAALGADGALFAAPYQPPSASSGSATGKAAQLQYTSFLPAGAGSTPGHWHLSLPVTFPTMPASRFPARPSSVPEAAEDEMGLAAAKAAIAAAEATADGVASAAEAAAAATAATGPTDVAALAVAGPLDEPNDGGPDLDTSIAAESAVAVAVGEGWCVAGTDRQNLRFFRTGGVQDMVFTTPGDIVTVAGRGAVCAVVYHTSLPSGYRQHLTVDVYLVKCSVDGATIPRRIASVPLPMRPYARLQWLGFSTNGMLCAHDSLGTLYATSAGCDWGWSPVCDTKAAALAGGTVPLPGAATSTGASHDLHDSMWPVDVSFVPPSTLTALNAAAAGHVDLSSLAIPAPGGTVPMLTAVFLKGTTADPLVITPRPVLNYLPLHVGIVETINADAIKLDEQFLRHEMLRLHRAWLVNAGLHPATAASLSLAAAVEAANNAARGATTRADAATVLTDLQRDAAEMSSAYTRAIDKSVLHAVKMACESSLETKAVQLSSRLHIDRSYTIAQRLAGSTHSSIAAERFNQLLLARQAVTQRGMLDAEPGATTVSVGGADPHAIAALAALMVSHHAAGGGSAGGGGGAGSHAAGAAAGPRFGLGSGAAAAATAHAHPASAVGSKRPAAAMAAPPAGQPPGRGDDGHRLHACGVGGCQRTRHMALPRRRRAPRRGLGRRHIVRTGQPVLTPRGRQPPKSCSRRRGIVTVDSRFPTRTGRRCSLPWPFLSTARQRPRQLACGGPDRARPARQESALCARG